MAATRLYKTYGSEADSKTKLTFSAWIKRSGLGATQDVFSAFRASDGYQTDIIRFGSDDRFEFWSFLSSGTSSVKTNRLFRDISAWYHIVVSVDTSQATASDRVKIYVNGSQETSFSTGSYPGQNTTLVPFGISSGVEHTIGAVSTSNYFDGCLSHLHYCDGYAYAASDFGETDSDTGHWKIKTSPSVSYGTNGFFLLKNDNSATDQSSNSNDFTVAGTITKSEDSPSNVFATLNPLVRHQGTLDLGNLRFGTTGAWRGIPASMGLYKGKWYWEFKQVVQTNWSQNGIMSSKPNGGYDSIYGTYVGNNSGGLALNSGNGDFYHDGSSGAYSTSAWFSGGLSAGDIVSVALDVDASKIWFGKNGTWGNSSDPAAGTNGIDFSGDADFTSYKPYFPACSIDQCECAYNFGNGYFGTTAVSSAGTNASNLGIFEFDVPAGFTAICTKGLNE